MKPFLLFAYEQFYPEGASGQFVGDFDSLDSAVASNETDSFAQYLDILDTRSGEWHFFHRASCEDPWQQSETTEDAA